LVDDGTECFHDLVDDLHLLHVQVGLALQSLTLTKTLLLRLLLLLLHRCGLPLILGLGLGLLPCVLLIRFHLLDLLDLLHVVQRFRLFSAQSASVWTEVVGIARIRIAEVFDWSPLFRFVVSGYSLGVDVLDAFDDLALVAVEGCGPDHD